jgi:hypothetical protein
MQVLSYLFSPYPGSIFNYGNWLIIYATALAVFGIIIKILFVVLKQNKALKRTLRSFPGQLIWTGLSLIILTLSRTKGVPFLSMRVLLFIAAGLSIYYILKAIWRLIKTYPEMKRMVEKPVAHHQEKTVYTTKKRK